jgi:hypothetical protein
MARGFGEEEATRLRQSCHEPAGLRIDRLSGAMLESILCQHHDPGPLRQTNLKPTCLGSGVSTVPPMMDPIDADALAGDFRVDEGSESLNGHWQGPQ